MPTARNCMTPKKTKKSARKLNFLAWLHPARLLCSKDRQQKRETELLAICPGLIVLRGTRSTLDYSESWKCSACNILNKPTKHLLFDMPAFYCSNCKQRGYVDFDVCYDGIRVNDNVQLIKQIKQQTKDDCMAYAWSSAVELVNTIWGVLMGKIEDIKLDVSDLLEKVARERRKIKKSNKSILKASRVDIGSSKRSDKMFSIFGAVAEKYGIKEKTNSEKQEYKIYKIGGSTAIPADDFPAICTAIASGFPLAAITNAGKRMEHLRFGQVYKAPPDRKFKRKGLPHVDTHAIVLVGAGRSKGVDYFHFLSSWGPLFCKRLTKTRKVLRGGIGKVGATDVLHDPIMLKPDYDMD